MRILIVEDDYISSKLLKKILEKHGTCDVANNGKAGFELFKENLDNEEYYDLICLDVMMPEMNGHETLKLIRKEEEERGIIEKATKVTMTTALSDFKNIKEAYKEQCEEYLVKPLDRAKVEAMLERLEFL